MLLTGLRTVEDKQVKAYAQKTAAENGRDQEVRYIIATRLRDLELRPAPAPEEGERAGPAPGGRVVALASRVATDGHTAAASAAFDYAHDGTVATRAGKG